MKLACLVTGSPRTFRRCVDSLKRYVRNYNVDFFLVCRDDNLSWNDLLDMKQAYNTDNIIVTNKSQTQEIEESGIFHANLIRMWHEVFIGMEAIKDKKDNYDAFMRVRFDGFFGNEVAPEGIKDEDCILITNYTYMGINDMFCIAGWKSFFSYCNTYPNLGKIWSVLGRKFTPEILMWKSLALESVKFQQVNIPMALRRPWFDDLTDQQYTTLVYVVPHLLIEKYENFEENQENIKNDIRNMHELVHKNADWPINDAHSNHFFPVEFDQKDQRFFRFFANQAWIYRYIDRDHSKFRFVFKHKAYFAPLEDLAVFFDADRPKLSFDEYEGEGWLVSGDIPPIAIGRSPKVKISFLFNHSVIPSKHFPNSTDHRCLSAAITEPEFI